MISPFCHSFRLLSAAMLAVALQPALAADNNAPAPAAAANTAAENAGAPAGHHNSPPFLAVINSNVISSNEFEAAASEAARQKFYHGQTPEGAVDELLREVADRLINRVLLLEEVNRRSIKPDTAAVNERIAQYERRYATAPRWQQERESILPALRDRLEKDSMLDALEAEVRRVPKPSEKVVRAYYAANPDKFTEPEKMQMSIILLQVDPSSTTAVWQAAEAEAAALRKRLVAGADFAELARLHSGHESAAKGGDLGYMHRGMLPEGIQDKVDTMRPGDLSEPTRILQGYAVFRYEALQPAKHHEFERVRERAADLVARDQAEQAWTDFLAKLRSKAKIQVNTQRYPALAGRTSAQK